MQADEQFLNKMRLQGDMEADDVVSLAFASGHSKEFYSYLSLNREDIINNKQLPQARDFLLAPAIIPQWHDEERLRSGQKFFYRYALDIMTLLGAMSLPYCFAASPGNKAIYLTEKMRKTPGKRLLDTAHFIIEVMKERAFSVNGSGAFEVQKTRLIHALVRYYIQNKTAWDVSWGVPVNQEDMAGTNLAFSYIIVQGMLQSSFTLRQQDLEDFLFAWKFIGYQLRIDEALLPSSIAEAAVLEEAIRKRHFHESPEGPLLATELIQHYKESFPAVASYFVDSQIRYFIGPEVSALLGLKPHPVKDSIVDVINKIRKRINRNFINPFSYKIMIRNHFKLKERYSATS